MAYVTLAQLTDRFGTRMLVALTDRGELATDMIDTGTVDRAIADADAVIDGYLAGRYALPMATTPPLVTDLAQAIVIWKLHTAQPDPKIEEDYKAAIRALRDISAGTIRLPVEGVDQPGTGGTGARLTDRERPLTADNLKGFI